MKKTKIRVFIVDDHMLVREGLKKLLSCDTDIQVIGETDNGNDAIIKIDKLKPDVVLLDLKIPGKSGLDVLIELNNKNPDIRILVLSMFSEAKHEVRMLKAGASGYLTKESSKDQLLNAVRKVQRGEKFISASLAQKFAENLGNENYLEPHEKLTDREYQILLKIASGKGLSAIAEELFLSSKTISGHRANILRKMEMNSNADLTRYVIDNGLI